MSQGDSQSIFIFHETTVAIENYKTQITKKQILPNRKNQYLDK